MQAAPILDAIGAMADLAVELRGLAVRGDELSPSDRTLLWDHLTSSLRQQRGAFVKLAQPTQGECLHARTRKSTGLDALADQGYV